jgi:hypothetical protein
MGGENKNKNKKIIVPIHKRISTFTVYETAL